MVHRTYHGYLNQSWDVSSTAHSYTVHTPSTSHLLHSLDTASAPQRLPIASSRIPRSHNPTPRDPTSREPTSRDPTSRDRIG